MSASAPWDNARNYYNDSAGSPCGFAPLWGERTADVCVVGGGFTGLATAHFLDQQGIRVMLLESAEIGHGGSGRNGGQLIPGYSADMRDVFRKAGPEKGRRLWDVTVAGLDIVKSLIARYGIACDWQSGSLVPCKTAREARDLESYAAFLEKNCGAVRERWDAGRLAQQTGAAVYHSALYDPDAAHFHPLKYVRALARALVVGGVVIFERSPAQAIETGEGFYRVSTPSGSVKARSLVLCGDSYMDDLVPELRRRYVLIRNAIIATEPLPEECAVLACGASVTEYTGGLHFYRKSADNRLLFGGGDAIIPGRHDRATQGKSVAILRDQLTKLFPFLKAVAVTHEWGGAIAMTSSYLPNVGRLPSGIFYANGFSGHGICITHAVGRMLADAIARGDESYRLFDAVKNMSFPGNGQWDTQLAAFGMMRHRLHQLF